MLNRSLWTAIVIALTAFSFTANANLDITCVLDDCLTEGWHVYDQRTGDSSIAVCREDDCLINGWNNEVRDRVVTETICKDGGCFNSGWIVYASNGRMLADVSCQTSFATSDCLMYGWTTYEPGRGTYVTRCLNRDCATYGWDVQYAGFAPQPVRCKSGGCFSTGWTVYR